MVRLKRDAGSLEVGTQGGSGHGKLAGARERVRERMAKRPDTTLDELEWSNPSRQGTCSRRVKLSTHGPISFKCLTATNDWRSHFLTASARDDPARS